jgi:hypothetical protein
VPAFSERDLELAALQCGVSVAHVLAIAEVESVDVGPFLPTGHPTVLFERHKFHAFTGGRFAGARPDLSDPSPGGYGRNSEQVGKLRDARALSDRDAVMATSWGAFQIMGFNYKLAGHRTVAAFEHAMRDSAREQILALARFLDATGLAEKLRRGDTLGFVRGYNGPDHEKNDYHGKFTRALARALGVTG